LAGQISQMPLPIRNVRFQLSRGAIFWREVGSGLPLVFLHGTWSDSEQWIPLLHRLGDRYHCLAPDLLGCGESSRPQPRVSIDLEVESLAEWLDSLHCPAVVLVAEGLGGWVAASYALRFPDRVRGLVLMAPEGVSLKRQRWALERSLVGRFPWRAWGSRAIAPLARLLGWSSVAQQLAWRRELRRSPIPCTLLFRRRARLIQAEQLDGRVEWLKVPMLLLQGDQASPTTTALNRAYGVAPFSELRILPGEDDLVTTQAEAIAAELKTWLASIPHR